jgi:hypothetical protein
MNPEELVDQAKSAALKASQVTGKMADDAKAKLKGGLETKPGQHGEGKLARIIENQTARLPSDAFLWAALGSITASAVFKARGNVGTANFVGQWAPTFLILGLYNKIVKVAGSDRESPVHGGSRPQEELH